MSNPWQQGNPDTESDDSDSKNEQENPEKKKKQNRKWSFSDDDSGNEKERVVRSRKFKANSDLKVSTDLIKSKIKIEDFAAINDELSNLAKKL